MKKLSLRHVKSLKFESVEILQAGILRCAIAPAHVHTRRIKKRTCYVALRKHFVVCVPFSHDSFFF